ncbi:hypothetical protein CLU79DRAFT_720127 [Phycomyces nitens]|nr:hypothetical protein CLU79DRAFT_720127 [Phycomyces nitens]
MHVERQINVSKEKIIVHVQLKDNYNKINDEPQHDFNLFLNIKNNAGNSKLFNNIGPISYEWESPATSSLDALNESADKDSLTISVHIKRELPEPKFRPFTAPKSESAAKDMSNIPHDMYTTAKNLLKFAKNI